MDEKILFLGQFTYSEEQEALAWIEYVLNDNQIFDGGQGMKMIGDTLRNGVYLCELLSKLLPSVNIDIHYNDGVICEEQCKANIGSFLDCSRQCGLSNENLFDIDDLYNSARLNRVIRTIICLKSMFSCEFGGDELKENQAPRSSNQLEFTGFIF